MLPPLSRRLYDRVNEMMHVAIAIENSAANLVAASDDGNFGVVQHNLRVMEETLPRLLLRAGKVAAAVEDMAHQI